MNCYRKSRHPGSLGRQSGAALIIAIFVLALAMIIITAMSTHFAVAARRTDNQVLADQAWYYLTGAEQLAIELLLQQLKERAEQQREDFFRPELFGQFDTDHGWLAFAVADLQGRFNINSLAGSVAGSGAQVTGAPSQRRAPGALFPIPPTACPLRIRPASARFRETRSNSGLFVCC